MEGGVNAIITQQNIINNAIKPRHLVGTPITIGDIYYSSGGSFVRLGVGSTGQILMIIGGVPTWQNLPRTGLAASRPSSGRFTGDSYLATDTPAISYWTGAAWKSATLS